MPLFVFPRIVAVQRTPLDHGIIAEFLAQPVHRLLGLGGAAVDEVGEVGAVGVGQRRPPAAEEADHGAAVGLAREQLAPGREDAGGELSWVTERARPRADL